MEVKAPNLIRLPSFLSFLASVIFFGIFYVNGTLYQIGVLKRSLKNMATSQIPKPERTWAMFAHFSSLLGWIGIPFANIVAPLIMWQMKKEEMPFGSSQAKECLNFQISLTIYAIISAILCLVFIGILGLIALLVINVIFTIIAAIKSNDGIGYRYPLTIRLIK